MLHMAAGEGDAGPLRLAAVLYQDVALIIVDHAHVGQDRLFFMGHLRSPLLPAGHVPLEFFCIGFFQLLSGDAIAQ